MMMNKLIAELNYILAETAFFHR
jgi:hypothetical protein